MIAGRTQSSRFLGGIGLYAAITAYVLFALFPIFWTLKISVTPTSLLYSEGITLWPSRTTFENFSTVLSATDFPRYFLNSVIVSLSTAALVTVIATLAGYAMSRFTFRGKAALAIMLLLTQTFPLVMVILPIYRMMGQVGLINSLTGLIIIYTAFNTAFATFLMQSFFDGIPKDLEEAAMIDGAIRFKAFVQIIAPLTLPGIVATAGFCFTGAWGEILFALLLNSSASASTFPVGLLLYSTRATIEYGPMMAAGVLALIPVCIFFFLIQRYLVQGLTAGAVKG